ncbi:hypothetical protein SMA5143A_2315 [Streptomyces sp. MA5143a]|nr:hypothetical protein SMA5143A_2315 [Streptomyces sp. MA5143a]
MTGIASPVVSGRQDKMFAPVRGAPQSVKQPNSSSSRAS